jgi:hypothetical protein
VSWSTLTAKACKVAGTGHLKLSMTATARVGRQLPKAALAISTTRSPRIPKPGAIARAEFKFLAFFTLALCVVTTLPYVAGHLVSVPGTVFTDVLDHSLDSNNYLAYARQAASGNWLFRNPMTAEPHGKIFFNLEWLAIGKLSSLLHVSLALATNIQRLLCLVLLCFGVYWLSTFLLHSTFVRRVALVATLAGGGFGWLAALHLLHIPINSSYFLDLTNANLFPFYWALKLPHFLVSESFTVLGLCFFLLAERNRCAPYYFGAGLCHMVSGGCRPYDMLFAMAATALYLALWRWENHELRWEIALRGIPIWMCVPLLSYYYWIFQIHPIFRWWGLPGRPAPSAWLLALSFGMSFLCLLFSVWRLRRGGLGEAGRFMLCCLLAAILLAHVHRLLHFSFQFATNILVPLVMIALVGLEKPITEWKQNRSWARPGIIALLLVNSFTSIALAGQAVLLVARGDFRTDSLLLEAYSWLNAHSRANDVILADFDNSNHLPQYTHNSVFCGYVNTVRLDDKLKVLKRFLAPGTSNEFREQLIQQNAIQFVLLTAAEEREIAALGGSPLLKAVFRNNAAVIFSVTTLGQATDARSPKAKKRES